MKKDRAVENGTPNKTSLLTRRLLHWLTLAVLLVLSVTIWRFHLDHYQEREQRQFKEYVDVTVADISDRLERYEMMLQGGVGVFLASGEVTRDEWRIYYEYQQISSRYPGLLGFGVLSVVPSGELAEHIEQIQAEGFPDYRVHPTGDRDEYAPVVFVEPFDAINQRMLGFDALSEPLRRGTLTRARDSGLPALSGRLMLVRDQDGDPQQGFLLSVPVYTEHIPPQDIAARRSALRHYVYALFRISDFMNGLFPDTNHKIDFKLYDGVEVSPLGLMYKSHATAEVQHHPMFTMRRTLDLYGHQWTLDFETTPAFEASVDRYTPLLILAAGVVISLLLFLFQRALAGTADRAQALAGRMTSALRESETRYRVIAENMKEMVWLHSADNSKVIYVNPSYERIWGRTCQSLYDRPESFVESVHPEDLPAVEAAFDEYRSTGSFDREYRILRPDGAVRWIHARAYPVTDNGSRVVMHSGMALNITKRKQAEDELKKQKTQLEQRNKALKQFNYVVSHELKTPLVSIESSLGLIQSTLPQTTDPELTRAFGYARTATRQMNNLLESLLLMFRIDVTDSDTVTTAFGVLVQDAVDQLTREGKLEGIRLTIATEGAELCGDREKLVQIWLQLIENAAKYMGDQKHPAIDIGVEQSNQEMVFYVRDNGMGIEQPYQGKIFGLFDKLDKTAAGTGMGLTLVQRIVDYYGGTLRVESEGLGKGSCFYFTLPGTR